MGSFANGFVFTSQPDFDAARKVVPGHSARGYKHNQHPVWLLDLWRPRGKLHVHRSPFCEPTAAGSRTNASFDSSTRSALTSLEGLLEVLEVDTPGPEISGIYLTLAVAAATSCSTFFFAADDDETDMACHAVSGSLDSFGCRVDRLSIQYAKGEMAVTPLNYLEDGEEEELQDLICAIQRIPGIAVRAPRDIEDGQVLYENPVGHWPQSAGDPAEILGLGTWDPLLNIDKDFAVVFEKLSE